MSNFPAGTAANVLVGPARILVAPKGTALPTLDGTQNPVVWPAAWKEVGYTEAGTELAYSPTIKDIKVDEEMAPVQKVLDEEKAMLSASLAETTLQNLNFAVTASILTLSPADATHAQLARLDVGSGTITEVMVGFEGISPAGLQRIMVGYRAIGQANMKMGFKRTDKTVFPVEWGLLADSTKPVGKRLYAMVDFLAPHL
jgi:hypothetical protein